MLESPERGKPERPERSSDWEDLRGLMTCVELGPEFKEAKVRFSLQCSLGVGSEANHRAFDSVRKKESNVGNREVKPERKGRVRLGRTLSSRTRAFRHRLKFLGGGDGGRKKGGCARREQHCWNTELARFIRCN